MTAAVRGLAVLVLVSVVAALVGTELLRRAVLEGYEAVVEACGLDPETFAAEQRGRPLSEVAADHGVDAAAVLDRTMAHSKYRWLRKVVANRP